MKNTLRSLSPGLLVSTCALVFFGILAINVRPQEDGSQLIPRANFVTEFDQEIDNSLHRANQDFPASVRLFNHITDLGSSTWIKRLATVVALSLVIVPCWMVIFRARTIAVPIRGALLAIVWILVLMLGELLNIELKDHIRRERPPFHAEAHAFGYSFPSGHSMGAFIAYGMLAYLLTLAIPHRRIRRAAVGLLALIVLLVGFSRVFLGAHWFTDVIGAFAAGACWLGFCITAIEGVRGILRTAAKARLLPGASVTLQPEPSQTIS
jgi:membrane-associated phospholipid phosphatase